MNFLDFQIGKVEQAGISLVSPGSIFGLPQLACALALGFAFLAWRQMHRRGSLRPRALIRAIFSRRILFNRSTYADLFYYGINTFAIGTLIGWGLWSGSTVSDFIVHGLRASFGTPMPSHAPDWVLRGGLTLAAFLGYEFGYYIDHSLKHRIPFLWAFHKTHHSAEVLTPLTVFRVHPIDTLIFVDILALTIGLAHGLFTYAAGKPVNLYLIDNTNVITVAFLFLLAQLQHSQFWIPLRGLPGRLLLSPAHHQIHHSVDPRHYNRNLGSFLAIFDWMFGTLAIPEKETQHLTFGVAQQTEDPHRVSALLVTPVVEAAGVVQNLAKSARPKPPVQQPAE
jgi:sterol desaturase/sphingolipid hydroxylase (fatty acid hydroxylase superfamily)